MPSRAVVRAGFASTSVLALALLTGSPALADDVAPQIGDVCTADTVLPAELICLNGLVAPAPPAADVPPVDPPPGDPPAASPPSAPGPAPADPPPVVPPVDVPPVTSGGDNAPPAAGPGTGGTQ